ncbi:MAG: DUF423 domain-containing protein [Bacteroidota bacterium]
MNRLFISSGAALAAVAVILGAFGAHALKAKLEAEQLQVFETGVKYQMYHSLALILLGILAEKINSQYIGYAGYSFLAGIVFFSGSLYLLSTRSILGIESWKFLGPVTPLGGLCFISGWVFLLIGILKNKQI